MRGFVWVDGRMEPVHASAVAPGDRGLLYGWGVFETLRTDRGRAFRLDAHLDRLLAGAGVLGIDVPLRRSAFADVILEVAAAGGLEEARVRITLTAGTGDLDDSDGPPCLMVSASALPGAPVTPVRLASSSFRRDERSPLSAIKSLSFLPSVLARREARMAGGDEAMLLNTAGELCEGATSNLFLVRDGVLLTPALECGPLPGIARRTVLELAVAAGLTVREAHLRCEDVKEADELFITNSVREVTAVAGVDGRAMAPGPVAQSLAVAFRSAARCESE